MDLPAVINFWYSLSEKETQLRVNGNHIYKEKIIVLELQK